MGSTTLTDLKIGDVGIVQAIADDSLTHSDNSDTVARRLCELGFVPGERVILVHKTPFPKGPASFEVRAAHIALRHDEAKRVQCKILPSDMAALISGAKK